MKAAKTQRFPVVIEQDEDGWYVASVPGLPGCHTQARSLDALQRRIREAIALCLEARPTGRGRRRSRFVGVHEVEVAH